MSSLLSRVRALRKRLGLAHANLGAPAVEVDEDDVEWAERVSGKTLDPWQADVIATNEPRLLLNCTRQGGKSESSSLRSACRALRKRKSQAIIAPTLRQSSVMFSRINRWLSADGVIPKRSTATLIELEHEVLITCLPGDRPDFIRGLTGDDLLIDEASRIKPSLVAAVTPIVATKPDATIVMLSTPAGQRGEFYRAWSSTEDWLRVEIPAEMCPRISKKFLAEELRRLGPVLYSQEYQCKFVSDTTAVLDPNAVAEMFREEFGKNQDPTRGLEIAAVGAEREQSLWSEARI